MAQRSLRDAYVQTLFDLAETRLDHTLRLSRARRLLHRTMPHVFNEDIRSELAALIGEIDEVLRPSDSGQVPSAPLDGIRLSA